MKHTKRVGKFVIYIGGISMRIKAANAKSQFLTVLITKNQFLSKIFTILITDVADITNQHLRERWFQ
jgi:hypothetical protein